MPSKLPMLQDAGLVMSRCPRPVKCSTHRAMLRRSVLDIGKHGPGETSAEWQHETSWMMGSVELKVFMLLADGDKS